MPKYVHNPFAMNNSALRSPGPQVDVSFVCFFPENHSVCVGWQTNKAR